MGLGRPSAPPAGMFSNAPPRNADAYTPIPRDPYGSDAFEEKKGGYELVSLFFTAALWGMVCAVALCGGGLIDSCGGETANILLIVLAVVAAAYLIEVGCSSARKYLFNAHTSEGAADYLNRLKATTPVLYWKMVCYHTDVWYDKDGDRKERRVNTWQGRKDFHFDGWEDGSGPTTALRNHSVVKLRVLKEKTFQDDYTRELYAKCGQDFVSENRWRDQKYDIHENIAIEGFQQRLLAIQDADNLPWWASPGWFVLSSLFGLTWPFRMVLNSQACRAQFKIVKVITCHPPQSQSPFGVPPLPTV